MPAGPANPRDLPVSTTRSLALFAWPGARIGAACLWLLVLCCAGAWAADKRPGVRIEITGDLTESHRQNIRRHLSLARAAENTTLSTGTFNRLYGKARRETARALEPFGYYDPGITLGQQQENGAWVVRIGVATGRPVVIEAI